MSRYIDADALIKQLKSSSAYNDYEWSMYADGFIEDIENAPTIDVVPKDFHDKTCEAMAKRHTEEIANMVSVVRCKGCKHRPIKEDADGADCGFNIIAPNKAERCPCLVEDGWYSWLPDDDFYCGYGEREDE